MNSMLEQADYKSKMLMTLMLFIALWVTVSSAAENEDLYDAAGRGDLSAVKFLIAKGADVNAKALIGETALMMASGKGHKEVVELLLAKGADVNAKRTDGATALMMATEKGHKEIRELLIKAGAK